MSDTKRFSDATWDNFFDFVFLDDRPLTRTEVKKELDRLGLDVTKAVNRVRQSLQSAKAREQLLAVRARRLSLAEQLRETIAPVGEALREHLQTLINRKFQGSVQAAYFRRLEQMATDEDLQSLLEDIHRLEAFSEGTGDVKHEDK